MGSQHPQSFTLLVMDERDLGQNPAVGAIVVAKTERLDVVRLRLLGDSLYSLRHPIPIIGVNPAWPLYSLIGNR